MPPPELHMDRWRASITHLRKEKFSRIAPTHFGMYDDPEWQLREVEKGLDSAERWLEQVMPADPALGELRESFTHWIDEQGRSIGLSTEVMQAYELANPLGMSADGLQRFWKKHRTAPGQ
jgi:hypothetical protein